MVCIPRHIGIIPDGNIKRKICTKCKEEYPATLEYFHKHKSQKSGLRPKCKKCRNEINRKYHWENREKDLNRNKKYYVENCQKESERKRKYYKNNKTTIRERVNEKNRNNDWQWYKKREEEFKKKYGIRYDSLHKFIKRRKQKSDVCFICNEKKKLELASIDHKYTKNLKDWLYLCIECHNLFDRLRRKINGKI